MSLKLGMLAAELVAAVVPLADVPVAAAIHNPNHEPPTDNTLTTVYVDVSCPNPDDDFWGGIGVGIGF